MSRDGGTVTFAVTGTDCFVGSNNPVMPTSFLDCDVSGLPNGSYTTKLAGADVTFSVPAAPDGGFSRCL